MTFRGRKGESCDSHYYVTMATLQKAFKINFVIPFYIHDFILLLQGCHVFHSSPRPLMLLLHLPSPHSPWFAISTSHRLQLTSPSSQVVPHSLWVAIWTSVHREGGLISVAIDDRLKKAGQEKHNRTNKTKENSNKRNVRMFSG